MFLELQLNYLIWLQELRVASHDIFTSFFLFITAFGEYLIPILTCAVIYWSIDKKLGTLIILNSTFSLIVNQLIKNMACIARPWILDHRIIPVKEAIPHAGGFSFPSGHSSLAVSCWGAIGLWYKKNKTILTFSIILCLLIAFSRNYLGVHTIQDIVIGLITTLIILICIYRLLNWCENGKNRDLLLTVAVSVISTAIIAYTYLKSYPATNGDLSTVEHIKWSGFPKLGLVFGSFWGWYFERNFVKFNPQIGSRKTKIIRSIVGLILLTLIIKYTGILLRLYIEKNIGSFIYMFLVSLFITLIYPWIITKLPLLNNKNR